MSPETIIPKGPLFGPDFVLVEVNSEKNIRYCLHIYPDAANAELNAAGLGTHYYFVPQGIIIAKRGGSDDFDFGVTIIKSKAAANGVSEVSGGSCSFSTTFGIPSIIIQKVMDKLLKQDFDMPDNPDFARHFIINNNALPPRLGMVNIVDNDVTVQVLNSDPDGEKFFIDAQHQSKGSIEAHGFNSFLLTLTQSEADIINRSIPAGKIPLLVIYTLKELFYVDRCTVNININVERVYDELSASFGTGDHSGNNSSKLIFAYEKSLISGAIRTRITMRNASLPDETPFKKLMDQSIQKMIERCYKIIKKEIFDWVPSSEPPADTSGELWNTLFGGAKVTLKAKDQIKLMNLENVFTLEGLMTVSDKKSGNFHDVESAIKDHPEKYFSVVDVGATF